jgi:hypothetical protein
MKFHWVQSSLFITTLTIPLILRTGSEFDEKGNLRQWWTKKSHENFVKRSTCLIEEYDKVKIFGYQVCEKVFSYEFRKLIIYTTGLTIYCVKTKTGATV